MLVLPPRERVALQAHQHILTKYPNSTYWLTTHNWRGENRAIEVLSPCLKPETVELLEKIQPTEWGELKTDAINFEEDFLWFDDVVFQAEYNVLEKINKEDCLIKVENNLEEIMGWLRDI